MNDENQVFAPHGDALKDDPLAPLFRHAGARPRPAAEEEREVRAALRQEWLAISARRRRIRLGGIALAASVLIAAGLALLGPNSAGPVSPPAVASVARVSGLVLVGNAEHGSGNRRPLAQEAVRSGETLSTSSGAMLSLEWNNGVSLRLDENTEIVLNAPNAIQLVRGQVYVDSGPDAKDFALDSLVINTPAGAVRHIGTQYLAQIQPNGIQVSVREGEVLVGQETSGSRVHQGEQLSLGLNGEVTQRAIPTYGSLWEWTERIMPELELNGMSALAFVQWAARETGRQAVFESESAREMAAKTRLQATVTQEPLRALTLILQTSDLEHEVSGAEIRVRLRRAPG